MRNIYITGLALALTVWVGGAFAIDITEDFAPAPSDWAEVNSRTAPANFGFSDTDNIGTGAGEAGGFIVRRITFTYYGMELPSAILSLDAAFSFSFDYKMVSAITGANVHVGFFNPANMTGGDEGWGVVDEAGNLIIANLDDGANLLAIVSPPGEAFQGVNSPKGYPFLDHAVHGVTVTYDPAIGDNGQVSFLLDDVSHKTIDLNSITRNADWNMTHFGIFASLGQDTVDQLEFYLDNFDISIGGAGPVNPVDNWLMFE